MIQAFQKFSQSKVARIFLAIVALSFVAFFGGGKIFQPHDPNAVVAEVGNLSISRYEFSEKLQQQLQMIMAQSEGTIGREEVLKSGLPQMVLNELIQEILLNLEAEHLGLTVSDETVRKHIQSIKAFQSGSGGFDRALFTQLLRASGISEDTFIAEIRKELTRDQLVDAIKVGAYLPDEMADRLFEAQYQYRQVGMMLISPRDMPTPATPDDVVLETFYKEYQKEFETPELRTATVLIVDPASIAKEVPISQEEIKSTYTAKPEAYGKQTLDHAKPLIVAELQKEKAIEKTLQITQELDDKIAGGATYEELAPTIKGAQVVKLEGIDAQGSDRMGTPYPGLPQDKGLSREILQTTFTLEEGMDSPFAQAKNGAYYTLRLDKVRPAAIEPFADIKDRVLKTWLDHEKLKAAYAKAEGYVTAFNEGDRKVSLMQLLPNLSLSEPSPSVPDEVKNLAFTLRPNQAGMIQTKDGFAVVVLKKIIPASSTVKEEKMTAFKDKLLRSYQNDLVISYHNALRVRYPVKINSHAIQALVSQ